jgi:putative hydrolase of the HAD superfamily
VSAALVVVFDLDDTLYPESTFVRSGFAAAARLLAARTGEDPDAVVAELLACVEAEGRGRQFDRALERRGLTTPTVEDLVTEYRSHDPAIELPETSRTVLGALRNAGDRLAVLTDGDPGVQRSKVRALGLDAMVEAVSYTWDEGPQAGKPDPRGFAVLRRMLGNPVGPWVYVADDPAKDFAAARRAGVRSVRVRTGRHASSVPASPAFAPDDDVATLDEVLPLLGGLRGD